MDETQMQHGRDWRDQTVRGWIATEKFRGARLAWDGAQAWSRGGLCVSLPAEIRAALPAGEGLMLHHPTAPYTRARVNTLLKVKLDPALARGVVRNLATPLPKRGVYGPKEGATCQNSSPLRIPRKRLHKPLTEEDR